MRCSPRAGRLECNCCHQLQMPPAQLLIVEDELLLGKRLAHQLQALGYAVTDIVASGQEALERAESNPPDLVLMDIALKGDRDGIETAAQLRERADIPLVYLTAYADEATLARAEATGAYGYLLKPYKERELHATIKLALQTHCQQRQARAQTQQDYGQLLQQTEAQLNYLVRHDGATGLPNRLALREQFERAVTYRDRQTPLPVLFVSPDRFRRIGESLGQQASDALAAAIAERLRACLEAGDLLASPEPNCLAAIANSGQGPQDAAQLARILIEALHAPFELAEREVFLTASVGIALYPRDGTQLDVLLARAKTAAEQVQSGGGDRHGFYDSRWDATSTDRLTLETALRYALEREELYLCYQPCIDARTGKLVGAEALLRWQHPSWGNIPPGRFIPIAEEIGAIGTIGEWVLRTACRQFAHWNAQLRSPLQVAINLSARQFDRADLAQNLSAICQEAGLNPRNLELEVTETLLVQDIDRARQQLAQLSQLGIATALDDFGTGYASLNYLKQLPFQTLKIDRAFVQNLNTDRHNAAIAVAIMQMAERLNLRIVAEGLETEAELQFLQQHPCHELQGFLLSPPLPSKSFERQFVRQAWRSHLPG